MLPLNFKFTATLAARAGITIAAFAFFLVLRPDVSAELQRKVLGSEIESASPRLIAQYLRDYPVRKLQIGTGGHNRAGWLNTDIDPTLGQAYLDAAKLFPIPDNSFHYVYSEALLEHITYLQGQSMLRETYRILAPGGRTRIATPDLNKFLELFQAPQSADREWFLKAKTGWHGWPTTPDQAAYVLNMQLREWGHQFVYTPKLLRASLVAAGFRDIRQYQVGESGDPALQNIEGRETWAVAEASAYETMVFEGVK